MTSPIRKNVLELNAALVVRALARLGGAIVLTRRLGLEGWGRLGWALTIFYVALGDDLGLGFWATRSAARDREFWREWGAGTLVLQLALAAIRYAILALVLPFVAPAAAVRHLALGFGLAAFPAALSTSWLHFARDRTAALRTASVVRECAWLLGVLVLVRHAGDLGRLVPLFVASELLETGYLLWLAVRRDGWPRPRLRVPALEDALGSSVPLWIGSRLLHWRSHLGTLIVGRVFGAAAVGAYDLAWRVAFNLWAVGATSLSAMTPTLARTAVDEPDTFRRVLRRGLRLAAGLSIPVPVLVFAVAAPATVFVLGAAGEPVVVPLILLAAMVAPAIAREGMQSALFAQGHTPAIARLAGLDLLVALPAALLAAAIGAGTGLATAMAIAETALLAVTCVTLGRTVWDGAPRVLARYAAAATAALAVALLVRPLHFILAAVLGAAAYAGVLVALRDPVVSSVLALVRRPHST